MMKICWKQAKSELVRDYFTVFKMLVAMEAQSLGTDPLTKQGTHYHRVSY